MPSAIVTTRNKSYYPALPGFILDGMRENLNRTQDLMHHVDMFSRDVLGARSQLDGNARRIELNDVNLAELTDTQSSDPFYAMKLKVSGEVRLDEQGTVVEMDLTGNNERICYEAGNSWFGLGDERKIYTYERIDDLGFTHQEKVTTRDYDEFLYTWNTPY